MKVPLFGIIGREVRGMHQAAYLLAFFALGSQCLALIRDRLLAASFGAGHTLDVYYAAFRIPDFLFATVASLLSLYAMLPVLAKIEQKHAGQTISFLRGALLFFFVAMAVIAGVVFVLAPVIVPMVAPGLNNPDLVTLVRILLLQPILLGASNIVAALTQLRNRFVLYSVSPLLYNLGIIFGIVALYPRMGLAGLGWGVVAGAFLHLMIQMPFFFAEKSEKRMQTKELYSGIWEVLKLSLPRTLALSAGQVSILVLVAIASYFAAGSISVFMFAYNLQAVPLTIIGVSYSVAAFPTLARLHAQGARADFVRHIETALRHIIVWSILATVFVIVMRAQLVRVILGAGAFDWTATRLTAAALALFILSLVAQSAVLLIARAYYAAGNTVKPLLYGVVDVVVSVAAAVVLLQVYQSSEFMRTFIESMLRVSDVPGTIVLMLALGYAVGSIVKFAIALWFFVRDFALPMRGLGRLMFEIFAASVIGSAVSYLMLAFMGKLVDINTTLGILTQGTVAGLGGLFMTGYVLMILGNTEFAEALGALKKRFAPQQTALEPSDIASR